MKGRKPLNLTLEEKKYRRTYQNRVNKRNQRLRKKIWEKISPSLSKKEQEEKYISELINYFNTYEFDIHFTGTYNPQKTKKISLQSLKSYTDKFVQLLIEENIIEYGLIFLDKGENDNNHTHIVIKSNPKIKNIHSLLKSKWMLGSNIDLKNIDSEEHKFNTLKYGFVKMGNTDKNNIKQIKKDLWNFIKK